MFIRLVRFFFIALAARLTKLESLVGERDARITALEKALSVAESKLGSKSAVGKFTLDGSILPTKCFRGLK